MKIFYAMPFTGKSWMQVTKERKALGKFAESFGLILNEQFLRNESKEKFESHTYDPLFIAEKDYNLIQQSDLLIADYSSPSIGRDCEIIMAKEIFDKRVVAIVPNSYMQNHPWIRLYSDYIVASQKEAFTLAKTLSALTLSSQISNLSREQKDLLDVQLGELLQKKGFSVVISLLPTELKRRWKQLFNSEYAKILDYSFKAMPKTIRVNTLKITLKKIKEIAKKYNWKITPLKFYKNAFRLSLDTKIFFGGLFEFQNGFFYVQEMSSMLPVIALDPKPGEKVLDIAAAPGSKTTQIAQMMKNKGEVLANDISEERLKILKSYTKKLGIKNIKINIGDGTLLGDIYQNKFDRVLVDVPCSNEGILRYKAHKFLEWNLLLIYRLTKLQKELLDSGFKALKVGGTLVYSTCSYSPEENEAVVNWLLKKYSNADIKKVKFKGIKVRKGLTKWEHLGFDKRLSQTIRIFPQDNNSIGFYLAKIIKKKP